MRLLHGSYLDIERPDLQKCKSLNDFGRGFYLTPNWKRAWQMAKRSAALHQGKVTVNSFLFYPQVAQNKGLCIMEFDGFTPEWAKFVLCNRTSTDFKHGYDIVIGPVADAVVDQEIIQYKALYGEGYLDDENLRVFLARISQFGYNYIQYCFCTQRAIDELIKD